MDADEISKLAAEAKEKQDPGAMRLKGIESKFSKCCYTFQVVLCINLLISIMNDIWIFHDFSHIEPDPRPRIPDGSWDHHSSRAHYVLIEPICSFLHVGFRYLFYLFLDVYGIRTYFITGCF